MRAYILYLFTFLFLTVQVQAAKNVSIPEAELQKLAQHVDNLVKRDSINEEIIKLLRDSLDGNRKALTNAQKNTVKKGTIKITVKDRGGVGKDTSLLLFAVFAFAAGFVSIITPCVFPMVPMTVSFFSNSSSSKKEAVRKAIIYGISIVGIYTLIGVVIAATIGEEFGHFISTHWIPNVLFTIVFVVFALSFFGLFEITLPNKFINKVDQQSDKGGYIGIFFMAFTIVLVSFSCTGPIVSTILVAAAGGQIIKPVVGMLAYSSAFALPFTLFALFPNWLKSLPKSGGWLNTTKVVLGFLELALAFKFLSNADLVQHWGILKYEVFMGLWIIIFAGLALYVFGKIKFPHDSPLKKLSFSRIASGVLVASFVIYLISGFRVNKETNTFTPLTLLSGLAPPVGYSFLLPNDCPNNLDCFKDLKEGIAYAQKVNKPIMLDFSGYACVNCRKMEEHVWPEKKIDNYLRNDYVLISLYVDDKKALPENEQILVNRINGGTRKLENYGHKWAHFQTQFFQTNSQPYYVLLSPDGKQILNMPVGYTPNETEYAAFLQCGLDVLK